MSVSRDPYNITFGCDECGEEHDTGETEFTDAVKNVKDEGWKIVKEDDGSYTHTCPGCQLLAKEKEVEDDFEDVNEGDDG